LEIKSTVDQIGETWAAYRKTNDARLEAIEAGDKSKADELGKKLERIEADVAKFVSKKTAQEKEMEFLRERIEELESREKSPGKTPEAKQNEEYSEDFTAWIRSRGESPVLGQKLMDSMRKMRESKNVTVGTDSAGGFAVPEEISRMITILEKKMSPVRDLIKVVQIGTNDYKELVDIAGESSGWVGETGSRTATTTPALRQVTPTQGELYAYPQVSEWSLDDIFFNVEDWLSQRVARDFAIQEANAVLTGDGSNKPTGMLNTTPTTAEDFASPLRAAAVYQYIESDTDDLGSPASPGVKPDSLIDLVYTLNSMYRTGASFIMNSASTGAVRKLKDSNGQYLWQPSLQAGQPSSLIGYPVHCWEQMDDIAADAFPIGFGNWKEAYVLVDRVGMRITRDNVTAIGHVKFYVRRREGGIPLNNDAAKFLRTIQ
jgi:HK97 family phage major capsid protein